MQTPSPLVLHVLARSSVRNHSSAPAEFSTGFLCGLGPTLPTSYYRCDSNAENSSLIAFLRDLSTFSNRFASVFSPFELVPLRQSRKCRFSKFYVFYVVCDFNFKKDSRWTENHRLPGMFSVQIVFFLKRMRNIPKKYEVWNENVMKEVKFTAAKTDLYSFRD